MYKCLNCGTEFEEAFVITEESGERWSVCPTCRGAEISEAKKCEHCGEYFTDDTYGVVCEECAGEIKDRFSEIVQDRFTPLEIDILNVVYDGVNIG